MDRRYGGIRHHGARHVIAQTQPAPQQQPEEQGDQHEREHPLGGEMLPHGVNELSQGIGHQGIGQIGQTPVLEKSPVEENEVTARVRR